MKQLALYIFLLVAMVLGACGGVKAAPVSAQDSPYSLQRVEHKQSTPEAQLEDASAAIYGVCCSRPQRLLPSGNIHSHSSSAESRLLFYRTRFLSSFLSAVSGGRPLLRKESAPVHFDVASKYYVICLRRLLC